MESEISRQEHLHLPLHTVPSQCDYVHLQQKVTNEHNPE